MAPLEIENFLVLNFGARHLNSFNQLVIDCADGAWHQNN